MFDDVLAEQLRIAAQRVELQAKPLHEVAVRAMRCQPHAVAAVCRDAGMISMWCTARKAQNPLAVQLQRVPQSSGDR